MPDPDDKTTSRQLDINCSPEMKNVRSRHVYFYRQFQSTKKRAGYALVWKLDYIARYRESFTACTKLFVGADTANTPPWALLRHRLQVLFEHVSNHEEWSYWTSASKPVTMQPRLLGRRVQARAYFSCKLRVPNIRAEKTHIMHFNDSQCFFCTILMKYAQRLQKLPKLCNISVQIKKINYARPHWT